MPSKDDKNDLALFGTYYSDAEAYIAKGVLETNGVPCAITNEIISSVYPLSTTPLGAIRLWVREQDKELACRIMQSPPLAE
jgi:hypothetical protein